MNTPTPGPSRASRAAPHLDAKRRRRTAALGMLGALLLLGVSALSSRPARAQPNAIPYPDVAAAFAALSARDGAGTIVTHSDAWTLVNEPGAAAQWSFTPKGHPAHPAVVRRIVKRGAGGEVSVETASLCEASAQACTQLLQEFEAMNPRITQAIRARGRQGSAQALPGAQPQVPGAPPASAPESPTPPKQP